MLLSRFWYVILGLVAAVALYVVYLAVGQYNRRNTIVMKEGLASDSQTVEWALKIDARRRLDQLAYGSLDATIQKALADSNGKKEVPAKSREEGQKALGAALEKIPAEFRPDAMFIIDREGRVIASVGFEGVANNDEFELGGYPAAFDALHGYIRDDTWVLGSRMYLVGARPVEYDVAQRPVGALIGLKEVSKTFVEDLARRTRTNLAFFAAGQRMAAASGVEGFEENQLELITNDLQSLHEDASYEGGVGRSDVRMVSDTLGAMYARLPGDAWEQRAGFAVLRPKVSIGNPMGFISGADDKDKASVPWGLIIATAFVASVVGIGLTLLEHNVPVRELVVQAQRIRSGGQDGFQLPRLRGVYRKVAADINQGLERIVESSGGIARRPADLESILGPVPAKPAMSAFSLPTADDSPPPPVPPTLPEALGGLTKTGSGARPFPAPEPAPSAAPAPPPPVPARPASAPEVAPAKAANGTTGPAMPAPEPPPKPVAPPPAPAAPQAAAPQASPPAPEPSAAAPQAPWPASKPSYPSIGEKAGGPPARRATTKPPVPNRAPAAKAAPTQAAAAKPASPRSSSPGVEPKPAPKPAAAPVRGPMKSAPTVLGLGPKGVPAQEPAAPERAAASPPAPASPRPDEQQTLVRAAPAEVMAKAAGDDSRASEWRGVYDDFLRTKRECGESVDGLTYEKFEQTLKKNQDALMQRHGCKKVRFTVYVKDGRASLKASPIKE